MKIQMERFGAKPNFRLFFCLLLRVSHRKLLPAVTRFAPQTRLMKNGPGMRCLRVRETVFVILQRTHVAELLVTRRVGVERLVNHHMDQGRFTRINRSLECVG